MSLLTKGNTNLRSTNYRLLQGLFAVLVLNKQVYLSTWPVNFILVLF